MEQRDSHQPPEQAQAPAAERPRGATGDFADFVRSTADVAFDDGRERGVRDWLFDAAVAAAAFLVGCVQMYLASTSVIYVDVTFREMAGLVNYVPNMYAYMAVGIATLPLVLRREVPWLTFGLALGCYLFLSFYMDGVSLPQVAVLVATFTVAERRDWRHAVAAAAIAAIGMLAASMAASNETLALVMRLQSVAFVLAAGTAGFAVRMYRAYLDATRRRLAEAEHGKEELAARRVAEERVRIARDVHDITAHSLTSVAIQAAAAQRLVDIDPEAAKEAIGDIRSVSKSALDEIRSMVGVLRGDEAAEKAPAEGTERMPDVVDYLRRAGLEVDYSDRGYDKGSVPAFVDMALFALAREAATNTVRHARASRVNIVLRSSSTSAGLSFSDDGVGLDLEHAKEAPGHGLEGMGERIEALNGTFRIDGAPGRGCSLSADIPMEVVRNGAAG